MAHYSAYEARHYGRLFNRYAGTAGGDQDRLTLVDLFRLMPQFGPELPVAEAKELIYRHDRSCTGALDFDDFLQMLSAYQRHIDQREGTLKAFRHFQSKMPAGVGLGRQQFARILRAGDSALADREIDVILGTVFHADGRPLDDTLFSEHVDRNLAWVQQTPPPDAVERADRVLTVHIFQASRMESVLRTKILRGEGINYQSLDPFVSVSCAGETRETAVMIGSTRPEWGQSLRLPIALPTTDMVEAQRWVRQQRLVFSLFDHHSRGVVSHSEWIGSASIPLEMILAQASLEPVHLVLALQWPGVFEPGDEQPLLDVAVRVSADGVTEYLQWDETVWLRRFAHKQRTDFAACLPPSSRSNDGLHAAGSGDSAEAPRDQLAVTASISRASRASLSSWESSGSLRSSDSHRSGDEDDPSLSPYDHYTAFYRDLRHRFRRKHFQIIAPDENNTFRPLFSFVRRLYPGASLGRDPGPEDMARQVSRIPGLHAAIPCRQAPPPTLQVASPALVVLRRRGNALEHSLLLCSLFLGAGLRAYVCMGRAHGEQRHSWVVTLEDVERGSDNDDDEDDEVDEDEVDEETGPVPAAAPAALADAEAAAPLADMDLSFESPRFYHARTLRHVARKRRKVRATHWESMTGAAFSLSSDGVVHRSLGSVVAEGAAGQPTVDDRSFPFERVECLFDNRNVWVNVQPSDLVRRTAWQLCDAADWRPFISSPDPSPPPPWYEPPELVPPDPMCETPQYTREFVQRLAEIIKGYRRHYLYIQTTRFYRPVCAEVQRILEEECAPLAQAAANQAHVTLETAPQLTALRERVAQLLPPRHAWHARVFRFDEPDVEDIVHQLAWTGILDSSVPSVVFFLASVVVALPWGLRSIWVFVGYMENCEDDDDGE